ncbi:MAG: 3-hydroxyacyl-ACP dehydratase [Gemmatimonadaceae bacterium]|nr:3-hydroxyacyl-ACP dehydratase [Chitinophagaceae bacterium]
MLGGDFYSIEEQVNQPNGVDALLKLNAGHNIFKGHFPSIPVVPGVCSMQIIKELAEASIGSRLTLVKADFLKFLAVITPRDVLEINASVSWADTGAGDYSVNGTIFNKETIYLKFKGTFKQS